jgi:hypothetical protein
MPMIMCAMVIPNSGIMMGHIRVLEIFMVDVLLIFPWSTADSWRMKTASVRTSDI